MFSQKEILLMISVVSVLLVFIVVLTILDIKEYCKEKKKNEFLDLDKNEDQEEEPMIAATAINEEPVEVMEVHDTSSHPVEDEILIMDEVEEPVAHQVSPVQDVSHEEIVVNNVNNSINNEIVINDVEEEYVPHKISVSNELNKVVETLVDENRLENTITSFEEEQERTAIISLDELLKQSDTLYSSNEVTQYNEDNEPISIEEAINVLNNETILNETEKEVEIPQVVETVMEPEEKELYTHKENMPFISSIYGVVDADAAFENTANFEKMDRAKTNEFMARLREMNENK